MTSQGEEGMIEPDSVWTDKNRATEDPASFGRVIVTEVDARGHVHFSNRIMILSMTKKDFLSAFTKGE
jgi:hypothetical protein